MNIKQESIRDSTSTLSASAVDQPLNSKVSSNSSSGRMPEYSYEKNTPRSMPKRLWNSFKPAKEHDFDTTGMTDAEIQNARMANAPMEEGLGEIQISLIAIGGSIGSGLFIGTGNDLAAAGPGGVIVGFCIVGVMLFFMMHSLGEVSVRWPKLSMAMHTHRLVDDSLAFSMSWIYFLNWLVSFPLELVASAITIQYWSSTAAQANPAGWVALFWVVLSVIGFCPVRTYGYSECVFSIIKIITILGFCIFGICAAAGANPKQHYFGTHYWHDPGSFTDAKSVITALVNVSFALSGIELVGMTSAEARNPAVSLPRAVKQTFWRVIIFYIVSLTICFCLVPYTNEKLGTHDDGSASPFVLAIDNAGVKGLPSVVNVVILLAALSVGNAAIFGSSRTLAAIAHSGGAPKFFGYVDRAGRPLVAIACTVGFGLIGFIVAAPKYQEAFDWLQAISAQATMFVWAFISYSHIMMRLAMHKQGRSLKEQYYTSPYGIPGSIIAFVITVTILCLEFWTTIWPKGTVTTAYDFFVTWVSLPIAIALYVVHKLIYRRRPLTPSKIDLITEARIKTQREIDEQDRLDAEYKANKPAFVRVVLKTVNLFF